ncbi:MAG: hypothetical protein M0008_09595 [Actinomycetota bacterium]|jgi:hypothetical protein|nr:hypothetical protein [Actinomycetota bacterium]
MKRVVADHGFGRVRPCRLLERGAHVHRDRLDLLGAFLAEFVEEGVKRVSILALPAPDDLAGSVIRYQRDERDEIVAFSPGDLVDADLEEATSGTVTPGRSMRRFNTLVTRTGWRSLARLEGSNLEPRDHPCASRGWSCGSLAARPQE